MPEADKRCFVRREVHIIDYYENASERLPHYARVLQGPNFKTQSSPTRTPLAKRSKPSVGLTVPVCPHCGSVERFASVAGEKTSSWATLLQRMPRTTHRHSRNGFRALQDFADEMVARDLSALVIKKGYEQSPTASHARRDLQDRVVHVSSYPRGNAGRCDPWRHGRLPPSFLP